VRLEGACEAYRRGRATLSQAAELAGLPVRELLHQFASHGVELNYGVEELRKDLGE
jgi:predicted HTH domain antitoxin